MKICVYTICKNEKAFVDKWLKSMSEADYMCVLDTGSTDGCYELLTERKNNYRNLIVEQKIIEPFRFDVARNENLSLVPRDADVLLENDMDEWLASGWSEPIRKKWVVGKHTRGEYMYVWSHLDDGSEGRKFLYNKMHTFDWTWNAPVHEYLARKGNPDYSPLETLNLSGDITLHHYPDLTKSRASYLPLLELRVKENPNDNSAWCYLADEYRFREDYIKSNEILEYLLKERRKYFNRNAVSNWLTTMGDNYNVMGDKENAELSYVRAIRTDGTYREPYLCVASLLIEEKRYATALGYLQEAEKKTKRKYVYTERDTSWGSLIYDLTALALYYVGDRVGSLAYAVKALDLDKNNERLQKNVQLILDGIRPNEW